MAKLDTSHALSYLLPMQQSIGVALVTGGAKRVGRAIVIALAKAGFDVAFTYHRSEEEAKKVAAAVTLEGRKARAIAADLAELPSAIDGVERAVHADFSRLDVLVNNASLYLPAELGETDLALTRRLMTVNVEAPMLLCQRFAGDLRASGGRIVNMIDLMAERPSPRYLAYCASKGALANLTLGLARALAPRVSVNGISPGVVEWPEDYPEEQRHAYLKRVPLGRAGTPDDVARAVVYLCTGGGYVTGQIVRLDGGRSIT